MTGWHWLDPWLRADPRDAGCDATIDALPEYAELLACDAGADPVHGCAGVNAHLAACESCWSLLQGLQEALRAEQASRSHRGFTADPHTPGTNPGGCCVIPYDAAASDADEGETTCRLSTARPPRR